MYHKTKTNPAGRFALLMLAFACGTAAVYLLRRLLVPMRYVLTPADAGQVSLLAAYLTDAGIPHARTLLGAVSGIALEMAVWLFAGLTVCAVPLFFAASALRGACFGFVLSLLAGDTASALAGWHMLPLGGWVIVTLLLLGFAAGHTGGTLRRTFARFFPTAGAAFWIVALCHCMALR